MGIKWQSLLVGTKSASMHSIDADRKLHASQDQYMEQPGFTQARLRQRWGYSQVQAKKCLFAEPLTMYIKRI